MYSTVETPITFTVVNNCSDYSEKAYVLPLPLPYPELAMTLAL